MRGSHCMDAPRVYIVQEWAPSIIPMYLQCGSFVDRRLPLPLSLFRISWDYIISAKSEQSPTTITQSAMYQIQWQSVTCTQLEVLVKFMEQPHPKCACMGEGPLDTVMRRSLCWIKFGCYRHAWSLVYRTHWPRWYPFCIIHDHERTTEMYV